MSDGFLQGDLVAQLNSHSASNLQVGVAGAGSKNRFCLLGTSGVTWQTVPTQVPIAVIRQPGTPLPEIIVCMVC